METYNLGNRLHLKTVLDIGRNELYEKAHAEYEKKREKLLNDLKALEREWGKIVQLELKKAPGNFAACIDKTVVLGTASRFYHNVSAGYKPTCLHVMFDNNVPGCLDKEVPEEIQRKIYAAIEVQGQKLAEIDGEESKLANLTLSSKIKMVSRFIIYLYLLIYYLEHALCCPCHVPSAVQSALRF